MPTRATTSLANSRGTTLFEMLGILVPTTVLAAGAIGFFSTQNQHQLRQDRAVALEDNARAAMTIVSDGLRSAGCGTPPHQLDRWINWAPGFSDSAVVLTASASGGHRLSIAACTSEPVAATTTFAAVGSNTITVGSNYAALAVTDLFNGTDKSLISIGDTQHAVVQSVAGGVLTIDTDPTTVGNQGLRRPFLAGTSITRVDVTTFDVPPCAPGASTGLQVDKHRGTILQVADGVELLEVTEVTPGSHYELKVTARAAHADPHTGVRASRTLTSEIHVRNGRTS